MINVDVVMQWLVEKVVGSGFLVGWGLSLWSKHVLPGYTLWVKDVHARLDCKCECEHEFSLYISVLAL